MIHPIILKLFPVRTLFLIGYGFLVYWLWSFLEVPYGDSFRTLYTIWQPLLYLVFDLFRNHWGPLDPSEGEPENKRRPIPLRFIGLGIFLLALIGVHQIPHSFYVLGTVYLLGLGINVVCMAYRLFRDLNKFPASATSPPDWRGDEGRWSARLLVLVFLFFLFINPWVMRNHWTDGDEPHYLLTTHSLLYDQDANPANNLENRDYSSYYGSRLSHQTLGETGEEQYSLHGVALSLLLLPGYAVFGWLGAMITMNLFATLLVLFLFRLMREMGVEKTSSLVAVGLVAISLPLLTYSSQLFAEVPGALLTVLLVRHIRWLRENVGPVRTHTFWILGLAFLLVFLKLKFLPIAAVGLIFFSRYLPVQMGKNWLRWTPIAGVIVLVLAADWLITGGRLIERYFSLNWIFQYSTGFWKSLADAFFGLFLDQEFGLFHYSPIFLLAIPGAIKLFRSNRSDAWMCIAFIGVYLLVFILVRRTIFYGGWNPPGRNLVPLLPFLALFLSLGLPSLKEKWLASLAGFFALIGFANSFATTLVPDLRYNYAVGSSVIFDRLGEWMGTYFHRFFPTFIHADFLDYALAAGWGSVFAIFWILKKWHSHREKIEIQPSLAVNLVHLGFVPIVGLTLLLAFLTTLDNHLLTWRIEAERAFHKTGLVNHQKIYQRVIKTVWVMREAGDRMDVKVVLPRGNSLARIRMGTYSNVGGPPMIEIYLDEKKIGEWLRPAGKDDYLEEEVELPLSTDGGPHTLSFLLLNGYANPEKKLYRSIYLDYLQIESAGRTARQ